MNASERAKAAAAIQKEVAENGGWQHVAPAEFVAAVQRVVPSAGETQVMSLVEVLASGGDVETAVLAEGKGGPALPASPVVTVPKAAAVAVPKAAPVVERAASSSDEVAQASLLPERRVDPDEAVVPLDKIPPNSEMPGDAPDDEFVRSVDKLGLLQPVGLIDRGGRYEIAFGRRRIKAARALGWDYVRAYVWPADWTASEVLALVENAQRKPNPASDYRSIVDLVGRGFSEKQIAQAMGMTVATVRARMRLDALPPRLKAAFLASELSTGMAEKIVRQSETVRGRLEERFVKKGELKASDIEDARRVQTKAMAKSLGGMLAAIPSSTAPDAAPDAVVLKAAAVEQGVAVRVQIRVGDRVFVGDVPALALSTVLVQAGLLKEVKGDEFVGEGANVEGGGQRSDSVDRGRVAVAGNDGRQRRKRADVAGSRPE